MRSLSHRKFVWFAALIAVIALLLREQFILITQVDAPMRGDVHQYVAYAYNLVHSATFSAVDPGTGPVTPDAFRGPGYPLFLAIAMLAGTDSDTWYNLALHTQAMLGAGTVILVVALGRFWLSRAASLCAGLLVAIWPHHIAATGALLSELLFGFVLLLATYLAAISVRNDKPGFSISAGLTYGYAYLVNPLIVFFAPFLAIVLWKRSRALALCLLLVPCLVVVAWGARNSMLPTGASPGRASLNFVQGSWPTMHAAAAFRFKDPVAVRILHTIDAEASLLSSDPAKGMGAIRQRMAGDPWYYTRWYLQKPWLLWDWDIRIGFGDIYVLEVDRSPLDSNPILAGMKTLLHRLNFSIFLLSGGAALVLGWRFLTGRTRDFAPAMVALLCIYLTLVHSVFQAEPRYSTAYRPFELLMLVTALTFIVSWLNSLLDVIRDRGLAP